VILFKICPPEFQISHARRDTYVHQRTHAAIGWFVRHAVALLCGNGKDTPQFNKCENARKRDVGATKVEPTTDAISVCS
jgi:hypothetical protein